MGLSEVPATSEKYDKIRIHIFVICAHHDEACIPCHQMLVSSSFDFMVKNFAVKP